MFFRVTGVRSPIRRYTEIVRELSLHQAPHEKCHFTQFTPPPYTHTHDVSKYSWTKVHSYRFKCSRTVVTQKYPFAASHHPPAWRRATTSSCFSSVSTNLSRVLLPSRAETVARNLFTDLKVFGVLGTCAPGHLRLNFGRHYLRDRIWHIHRAETPRSVMPTASDTWWIRRQPLQQIW